ncbi:MAG: DNA recombination protein RmuC, partial [Gammaproteobacteria bacterium]|nr:DNA recombination protein RmuC [Gammaproteobacteria bacterium]
MMMIFSSTYQISMTSFQILLACIAGGQALTLITLYFFKRQHVRDLQYAWKEGFHHFEQQWFEKVFHHDKVQHQQHLKTMTQLMQSKLNEGFEKTSATFHDVLKRLVIIDEAQKKISELSTHVVDLQEILVDKRARGAFGEVQLQTILANMLPAQHYRLQHTLPNQKRADCLLILPPPTGNIVIDAKFPLETFQRMMQLSVSAPERKSLQQQFKISGQTYRVLGVLKKEGESMFGESSDFQIIIPYKQAYKFMDITKEESDPTIMVKPKSNISTAQMMSELRGIIRSQRRIKPAAEDNFALNETRILQKGFDDLFA